MGRNRICFGKSFKINKHFFVSKCICFRWIFEDDLVDFPIESANRYLTFEWTVRAVSSGRLTFAIRSSELLLFTLLKTIENRGTIVYGDRRLFVIPPRYVLPQCLLRFYKLGALCL